MKQENLDRAIVNALHHNWRMSVLGIAKQLRVSRRVVDYRLQTLQGSGVIRSILTVFNYAALGYKQTSHAFIQLRDTAHLHELEELFRDTKRCISWGKLHTEYDLFTNWIFKDRTEAQSLFAKLKQHDLVKQVLVVYPIESILYPLKAFHSSEPQSYTMSAKSSRHTPDDIDKTLLLELSQHARKSIVDLSRAVKLTPQACMYRLRRLKAERIILGSLVQIDIAKAGYFASIIFIDCKVTEDNLKKLKRYATTSTDVNYYVQSSEYPQFILQLFHKDEASLRKTLRELQALLGKGAGSFRVVLLEDDLPVINPLPFL